jgi:hypothetical protein
MLIIVIVIAAVVVATPLLAAAAVTFASLREDAAHSLSGRPPGRLEAVVRRLLGAVGPAQARRRADFDRKMPDQMLPRPRRSAEDEHADGTLTLPRS